MVRTSAGAELGRARRGRKKRAQLSSAGLSPMQLRLRSSQKPSHASPGADPSLLAHGRVMAEARGMWSRETIRRPSPDRRVARHLPATGEAHYTQEEPRKSQPTPEGHEGQRFCTTQQGRGSDLSYRPFPPRLRLAAPLLEPGRRAPVFSRPASKALPEARDLPGPASTRIGDERYAATTARAVAAVSPLWSATSHL